MPTNKVIYGNTTVMDISDTTAEAADVLQGEVFYAKSGARSVGTMSLDDKTDLDVVADAYDSSLTYALGEYCIYEGELYECTTAISTAEAWTAAHWTKRQIGPELADLKEDLENLCLAVYDATDGSIVFRSSEAASYDSSDGSIVINV